MIVSIFKFCYDSRINNSGVGVIIITILGGGGDVFRVTWAVFIEFCFEYCLKYFEIDIAAGVLFFGVLGLYIET